MDEGRHGDHSEAVTERQDPIRVPEEVAQNQPGSKGDGSSFRAGGGSPGEDETVDEQIVRSGPQKPNPNQAKTEPAMEPGGDRGHKRNTL